jgi:hypothetical protein
MIVLYGVDEFPSGAWTEQLAARFADRIGAEPLRVNGGSAADHVPLMDAPDNVLLFGHAPSRGAAKTLRGSPSPVVVAPAGVSAGDWGEVVLGSDGDTCTEEAAATAGVLAARLGVALRIVVIEPESVADGKKFEDVARRLAGAAQGTDGRDLPVIEAEVRAGQPAQELLRAAWEHDSSLVVVAADAKPSWFDVLRPSFTAELLHDIRDLAVVVPPAASLARPFHAAAGRERLTHA